MNIEHKKAWSSAGIISNGGYAVNPVSVDLNVNFPHPGEYTAQFNIDPILTIGQKCFAEIIWSVEGNSVRRVLSVLDGASITGRGQGIKVKIFDQSAAGGGVGTDPYRVAVLVTTGGRGTTAQPVILDGDPTRAGISFVTTVPPVATPEIDVPLDCGIIAAFINVAEVDAADAPIETDEILVTFFSLPAGGGTALKRLNYSGCNKWVPIAPGTRSIQLRNNRPVGDVYYSITWGVDG